MPARREHGGFRRRLGLVAAIWLVVAGPALAGPGEDPAGEPAARAPQTMAEFDRLLSEKRYSELGDALEHESEAGRAAVALQWQKRQFRKGESAYIGFVYARDLWRAADAAQGKSASTAQRLRDEASIVALYTMAQIVLDGVKCEDGSAPNVRTEQFYDQAVQAFAHAANLSRQRRDRLVDTALALERTTAPRRDDDDFVCQGGLQQMNEALSAPDTRLEEAPADGSHGRHVTVVPGRPYAPRFVDKSEWQPKQQLARKTMRSDLCRMLDQVKT